MKTLSTSGEVTRRNLLMLGGQFTLAAALPVSLTTIAEAAPAAKPQPDYDISDIVVWPILRSLSIVEGVHFPNPVLRYAQEFERRSGVPLLFDQAS